MASDFDRWKYPALAKPDSDGAFCYHVQRRISNRISLHLANRIGPNAATSIDLVVGAAAAVFIALGYWSLGALLIQLFGVFSCVDGEIARIQHKSSMVGDFLDTITDRLVELLVIAALAYSLGTRLQPMKALAASFFLLGGVFLLTVSSEKFRSTFKTAYPKKRFENFFSLCSAGSDARLLILSVGLIAGDVSGYAVVLLWTLWVLVAVAYANFVMRVRRVHQEYGDAERAQA